jgi:aspartate oxidase
VEENDAGRRPERRAPAFEPPSRETREAGWRLAGPLREAEGLAALGEDPYLLARAISVCAGERRESRGGHLRTDFGATDPDLDGVHFVLGPDLTVRRESWG